MAGDYEYRGLMARAWDLLRGDTSTWPDREFYRAVIERRGGPALDVGCGTGRLLLDYLAIGLDVDGVDNSPEMLAICREKAEGLGIDVASRLFEQEMDALTTPRRYATIFVPSLSFQLLTDPSSAARAMERFHDGLAPGGMLVVSFKSRLWPGRRTPPQMAWTDWFNAGARERGEDRATIRRWTRARFDHGEQLEHEENRYQVLRDGVVVEEEFHRRSPCVRWYSQGQAAELFDRAGFGAVTATAADGFAPAAPEDNSFKIWGARE
ncbi:MAG TPA: class I SAM-dependent methyltransferase [Caulobacteraceae bacterium]|nr:class I SAM-dependent methyltransferase [Caulobacteraceae bacterium]